ncbi:MAG TPA: hypothetical protein VNI82_00515 [Candidatus Nitrosotenuis sp.]|nr:hypothetical protein [Candidatus Nitrosotenuis sp.]
MKRLGLILTFALVALASPFVFAAEPLDDARVEIIKQNCSQAQATMQRVLRSDTATRINRGRAYEEMIKLLAAFNSRAAINTLNVPDLIQTTAAFETEFIAFKSSYTSYDISAKDTLRIKCQEQPVTFYDSLTRVRENRAALAAHIVKMNEHLEAYTVGLDDVASQIELKNAGTQ